MPQTTMPNVLAIETSTAACSVALIYKDKTYSRHEILPQKHAHRVLAMVDEVLLEAGIDSSAVDLLAYGEGPGAFTGIRIASGVIQGLALGWNKPVVAVSSLLAMAEEVFHSEKPNVDVEWAALLDARMNEVYLMVGEYCAETEKITAREPILISPDKVQEWLGVNGVIGVGDIETEYPQLKALFTEWHATLPNAVSIARLALRDRQAAMSLEKSIPNPLYLRNHIADTIEERKLKKQVK
ncbi:tRNA (adenosine(37)-N6)-threonylcarbamoyltransferase complex dimerization subunit type 1 TsaB [Thiomicrorhabdus immobilis]|uniref:tRNA threonylcarbamoyladenosine biosynthesis protein TsaB n=1 Tax=Thiomicrorhabdus immobilis TaxID=2791037 RepID=A0ABN6CWL0_9GAMM|nr:tRNA (adenosine(37)-N6)-threonylcarbamoyltransferase complex dimerization subunit type 1 TsaB [Thiomicrorhabdus immobilis]BCN93426.1 tRNA (adenosine(37)-N6)-threonylcarbamoyltransferase complex dimerization subunit type 1 TsaB [Thiomicrorhabdus immobilis]